MKYNIFSLAILVWLLILPLAILATPFIVIAKLFDVTNSFESTEMLKDFFDTPRYLWTLDRL